MFPELHKAMLTLKRIAIFVTALVIVSVVSYAQEKAPTRIHVGIYVLNIGRFEVSTGSYTVDFYLSFKCDQPCDPTNFEFMNGRAASLDKLIDTPTERFYRIQANLAQNIDLKNYPFDQHLLTITLEDKRNTIKEQIYIFDAESSAIDPSVILVGWELAGWEARVEEHFYQTYNERYSRLIFGIKIQRVALTAILKSFLPVFFMVFVGLLSLLLAADKVTTRLSLNVSTLLGAVMFHLNLTSSIPPVGYLTFADKFMLVTYGILILILFSGVLLMRHADKKDQAQAERIYRSALVSVPIGAVLLYAMLFLFFF